MTTNPNSYNIFAVVRYDGATNSARIVSLADNVAHARSLVMALADELDLPMPLGSDADGNRPRIVPVQVIARSVPFFVCQKPDADDRLWIERARVV